MLKLELNIALLPEAQLADKLVGLSQTLAKRHPTIVRLGRTGVRLSLPPHLTLLQTALPFSRVPEAHNRLTDIAARMPVLQSVVAEAFAYNGDEASFEVQRRITDDLVSAQTAVIEAIGPLRGGLLVERDPAGNDLRPLLQAPGILGDNIRTTGYAEVGDPRRGGLYRPHDTTNWFEPGTQIHLETEPLPSLATLQGDYSALGLFVLGPQGTCPQLLAAYELTG